MRRKKRPQTSPRPSLSGLQRRIAITDRIDTPYNTNGRSMHPDLRGSDEAKQDAQLKRIERRAKKGDAAK